MARGVRLKNAVAAPGAAWIAVGGLLAAGSLAGSALSPSSLDWQPSLAWREPWRWWSAAFVHFGAWHLAANLLATAVVVAWGAVARVPAAAALAWLAAWPVTHLALLAQPQLQHYGGLSGVLHAGVAVVAMWLLVNARVARRAIGGAVLAGLALKIVAEAPWQLALQPAPGWGVAVAPLAHAAGALAGLACGAVAAWAGQAGR
ncbi:MAG: rhombosortase [Burkholderiaceae bacterium]|nr:rhombosortase [Burkholderiaceae bacterium]